MKNLSRNLLILCSFCYANCEKAKLSWQTFPNKKSTRSSTLWNSLSTKASNKSTKRLTTVPSNMFQAIRSKFLFSLEYWLATSKKPTGWHSRPKFTNPCKKSTTYQSSWSSNWSTSSGHSSIGVEITSWSESRDLAKKIFSRWPLRYATANSRVLMDWNKKKSPKLTLQSLKSPSCEKNEPWSSSMPTPAFMNPACSFLKDSNQATHSSIFSKPKTLMKHLHWWNIQRALIKSKTLKALLKKSWIISSNRPTLRFIFLSVVGLKTQNSR